MDIATSLILVIILFHEAFNYGDGAKFRGYVGTIPEPLSVEFCNTVKCHIFVNNLTCC
jgi:hypothetical protein